MFPPAGFPHSAIQGSMRVCRFPWLIAAYRGLHRLRVPRHPPLAFSRLTTKIVKQNTHSVERRALDTSFITSDSCSVHPVRRRRAEALDGATGALANHGEIRFPLTATSLVK